MKGLKEKVVIVTGGAGGIGAAVCYTTLGVLPQLEGAYIPRLDEATWSFATAGWLALTEAQRGTIRARLGPVVSTTQSLRMPRTNRGSLSAVAV